MSKVVSSRPSGLLEESQSSPLGAAELFQSGHSRTSSYASQHSRISGTRSPPKFDVRVQVKQHTGDPPPPPLYLPPPCRLQHRALLLLQPVGPHASQERLHGEQRLGGVVFRFRPDRRRREGRRTSRETPETPETCAALQQAPQVQTPVLWSLDRRGPGPVLKLLFFFFFSSGGSRTRWRVTPPG